MRSVSRTGEGWTAGPGAGTPHYGRMCRCAARISGERELPERITYLEHPDKGHALVVDTGRFYSAEDVEGRRAAILWKGPIPVPTEDEVHAALHLLHYAGVSPELYRVLWLRHVVAPGVRLGSGPRGAITPEDRAHFRDVLANYRRHLSPALQALYEAHAEEPG